MLFLLMLMLSMSVHSVRTYKVVCYHGDWSAYRSGDGKFNISNIDPYLCTHMIYGFVGMNSDYTIKILDPWLGVDLGGFVNFNNLRAKNPKLKTLIAIGGWNEGSERYSTMAASASNRKTFIQSAINFIQKYGFNGLDWDWEYPAQRGGAAADKTNFVTLLSEMRVEFDKCGFLLSAAVAGPPSSVDTSYNVPALSAYLDFINVMTYDLHGPWDSVTGQNAPLYPSSVDVTAYQKSLTVDACISAWIERGAPPSKIVMGVSTYGKSYTLKNKENTNIGAPTIGGGAAGKYSGESGYLGYNEICEYVNAGWTVVWDDQQKVPYAYKGDQWIGYDNTKSIAVKVGYAKSRGLGGVMVWAVETDDFHGRCGPANPILNQIKTSFN